MEVAGSKLGSERCVEFLVLTLIVISRVISWLACYWVTRVTIIPYTEVVNCNIVVFRSRRHCLVRGGVENRRRNASAKVSFNSFHSIKTKYHLFFLPVLSSGRAMPAHSEERHAPLERDGKNFFSFFMPKFSFQRTERQTFSMERQTEASYPARDLKPLLRILTWWQARFFLLCLRYGHSDKRYFVVGGGVDSLSLDGYTDDVECGLIYRLRYYLLVNGFCRSVRAWLSDRYRRTFLTLRFWPSCFWGVRT